MRIDQMRYLVEIADAGSLSAAAEKLHISQPRISQFLTSFEAELNTQIFIRSRLGTQPTETGKLVIQKVREIVFQAEELKHFAHQTSNIVGKLTIATVPSMCTTILPKTLSVLKTKYPKLSFELHEEGQLAIRQLLLKGEVDLGLGTYRDSSEITENLTFKPLFKGQVMACVGRQSPLAGNRKISFQDIINFPIVIMSEGFRMHSRILSCLKKLGEPNVLFTARNPGSIKRVVMEGLAIGFDPDIALKVDPYVLNGDIIPLQIAEEKPTSFGIWSRKKHASAASQEFIKELKLQAANFTRIYNL